MNILEILLRETNYVFHKVTSGGQYAGPCPFCHTGTDRFCIWTKTNRYWCRQCLKQGDSIQFLIDFRQMSYRVARDYLGDPYVHEVQEAGDKNDTNHMHNTSPARPTLAWQEAAYTLMLGCANRLLRDDEGAKALRWLHERKLTDEILHQHQIGYNPMDMWIERSTWGLPPTTDENGHKKKLWLPKGVVIPWWVDNNLWGIRIRRPKGKPKYYWLPGGTSALFNVDVIGPGRPAILLEGEIDALTIANTAGDLITAVATGSTHGARRTKWAARLASTSVVLVAYDADSPGELAAQYWLNTLPNARRWRPYWGDVNDMAQGGVDVAGWVRAGLSHAHS